jgi:hypothetical protein
MENSGVIIDVHWKPKSDSMAMCRVSPPVRVVHKSNCFA